MAGEGKTYRLYIEERTREVNQLRRHLQMQQIQKKERKCLKCEKTFMSMQFNNRICDSCLGLVEMET